MISIQRPPKLQERRQLQERRRKKVAQVQTATIELSVIAFIIKVLPGVARGDQYKASAGRRVAEENL